MCRDKLAANHTAEYQRELAQPAPGFHTSPSPSPACRRGLGQPRLSVRRRLEGRRGRPGLALGEGGTLCVCLRCPGSVHCRHVLAPEGQEVRGSSRDMHVLML